MLKKYVVLQDGIRECGSACLLSIIRYYKGNVSLSKLLELTKTTKDGTNFYNLSYASNEIGLSAKAYKVDNIDKLYSIEKPFISQVIADGYKHFIVVYKMHNQIITIMDPAKGMVKITYNKYKEMWTGYILVLEPYKQLPYYDNNNFLFNNIKDIFKKNIKMIINVISLSLFTIIFTCAYSYFFKIIIDNYVYTDKFSMLIITVVFMIILIIKTASEYLRNNLLLYLNQKIDLSIITTTINKIISLPYSYYKNKTTGEIISRINDLMYVKNVISKIITTIFLDVILSMFVLIILFLINKNMTLVLFLIILIYCLVFIVCRGIIRQTTNIVQDNNAKVNSLLVESLSSYSTIKGMNLEDKFINKINKKYLKLINNNLKLTQIFNIENFIKDLFEGIILLFVTYLGITYVMDKSLSIGGLITYNTLLLYFITPIRNVLDFYKELYYVKNSIIRINNLFEFKYDKLDKESNLSFNNSIHLDNLSFSYNNKNNVLNNISLDIKERSKVLLLGVSGSGKTTLLKLLYRYYIPERNKIFIGKYDVLDYELLDIRKNISYLSQDEFIYTDTVKNNILLGRDVSNEEFLNVCKMTYVTDIIKNNPLAYDMPLEENGINISGGQRQRIILARSLLKKSKIILIDEGLNEIDINLERKILKNIFSFYPDITIIIISHRTENIDLFDKVINLSSGMIGKDIEKCG